MEAMATIEKGRGTSSGEGEVLGVKKVYIGEVSEAWGAQSYSNLWRSWGRYFYKGGKIDGETSPEEVSRRKDYHSGGVGQPREHPQTKPLKVCLWFGGACME